MADASLLVALRRVTRNDQVILSVLAVTIGIAAGVAAIGFRYVIDLVQRLGFGFGGERIATLAAGLPQWRILLVPAAGGRHQTPWHGGVETPLRTAGT